MIGDMMFEMVLGVLKYRFTVLGENAKNRRPSLPQNLNIMHKWLSLLRTATASNAVHQQQWSPLLQNQCQFCILYVQGCPYFPFRSRNIQDKVWFQVSL